MRRLCRARRGLCLDIVVGNTLFSFSLLGHLDNVRYKVISILSMLMTSSSNWLLSACDTIHLIVLSRVRVACGKAYVCMHAFPLTKLNAHVENRYMQNTPLDHPSLSIYHKS